MQTQGPVSHNHQLPDGQINGGIPKATVWLLKHTFRLRQDFGADFLPSFLKHVVESLKPAVVFLSGLHSFSFEISEAQTEVSASEQTPIHISNHK